MRAADVARELFNGNVSAQWITRNLRAGRLKLGHNTILWREYDVLEWIESRRTGT